MRAELTAEGFASNAQDKVGAATARAFFVERDYFQTLRVPIVAGRAFSEFDTASSTHAVIINEAMAKRYWPNENALGKRLTVILGKDDEPRQIVGVVRNMRQSRFETLPEPALFIVLDQQPPFIRGAYSPRRRLMTFVFRTADNPANILASIRTAAAEIAPEVPVAEMRSVDDYAGDELKWREFYAKLLAIFAGIATFLAAIGIYGIIAYSVQARRQELGIRVALGASRRRIPLNAG